MNWKKFNTFGESKEKAFEIFSNQIFKVYCQNTYKEKMKRFVPINGAGGDGGIEAYAELSNGNIIAIQSKCFFDAIGSSEISQIRNSINTANKVRNNIQKYIVSIPRDLANKKDGGKVFERKKIEDLFNEFKYTNIEFELWGEFELSDYIIKNTELVGVHKFWFNNTEIDFSNIIEKFQLKKNGYLKEKYNEKLHVKTNVNRQIERILGDEKYIKGKINKANKIIEELNEYLLIFEKYLEILKNDEKEEIEKIYNEHSKKIKDISMYLLDIIKCLKNENNNFIVKNKKFNIDTEWFYNLKKESMSIHYNKMKQNIEIVEKVDVNQFLEECEEDYSKKNLLIIGDFGTGKTHSVVNQIENELKKNNVAILIRASDVKSKSSWKEILTKELGLSETWAEEEIFSSLELLANRNQYILPNTGIIINKKILICIDGIDEHSDYQYWYEKQLEANELIKKYKNFRFCFIGRRYAFKKLETLENYKVLNFDYNPGYDANEMFDKYMLEYNIKFSNSINIKPYLNNPLVLKSFVELYQNKKIDTLNGININLVQLFKIKLDKMNEEFLINNSDIFCRDVLNRSAKIIAEFLYSNTKISKKNIIQLMNNDDELRFIEDSKKVKIIESMQKYGLLYVETKELDMGIKSEIYYKGMQPIIDYIMARKLSMDIIDEKYDKINNKINLAVLKLCALILFEENQIFLLDIKKLDIEVYNLKEATYYAIVNANPLKTIHIKDKICKLMLVSSNNMRLILNNIIIPCSKIPNHPLGAEILNEILLEYIDMASRDKIWSLPELLRGDKIKITQDIIINNENPIYFLDKDDKHNGLPLIYVWLLTGVNNMRLYFYRNQLMKWAILCPHEYILLLKKTSKINDIQLLEQIYGISMCLCYKTKESKVVREILNIIEKNFFIDSNIRIYDFQIRMYIIDIAELAYKLRIINQEQLKKYLPPYKCNKVINLNLNAAKEGNRMSGYSAIDYDLARYVLCDHISYRFFEKHDYFNEADNEVNLQEIFSKDELIKYEKEFKGNMEFQKALNSFKNYTLEYNRILLNYSKENLYNDEKNNTEKEFKHTFDNLMEENKNLDGEKKDIFNLKKIEFLKKEGKKIKKDDLGESEFIISAAYQYLLECGWNELDFYGKDKIDSEIRRRYNYATHGTRSSVMSFVEKYIWCFRNEIIGYLADHISINGNEDIKYYNYCGIDDVLNPITEYEQKNNGKDVLKDEFIQEEVFKNKEILNIEDITRWIKSEDLNINLSKWITIKDKYLVLNRYDCFIDIRKNLEFTMWISAGIINKNDIKYLQDNIDNKQKILYRMLNNPDEFSEYTNVDGSITPFEIINFDWNDIKESSFTNISLLDNSINRYKIYKTYESAYNVHTEFNEIHYKIPSKRIRNMLNINNNIEFEYKNNDETVAIYEKNNKSWEDHHNILVADAKKLNKKLNENNETLVWFIRIDKELNSLGREIYKEIDERSSSLITCWFEGKNLKINYVKK